MISVSDFAGATTPYSNSSLLSPTEFNSQCNSDCSCSTSSYQPVCGDDGLTYFSPCFAGCTEIINGVSCFSCSSFNRRKDFRANISRSDLLRSYEYYWHSVFLFQPLQTRENTTVSCLFQRHQNKQLNTRTDTKHVASCVACSCLSGRFSVYHQLWFCMQLEM